MTSDDSRPSRVDRIVETVDRLPLVPTFFGGVLAFVGGYLAFVVTVVLTGNLDFERPVTVLQELGGFYYNAQNVHLLRYREIAVGDQTIPQQVTINLIQLSDPSLPRIVYYLVPVLALLVVTAVLVDRYVDAEEPFATTGATIAGVTLGYLLVAMIGTVLVTQRTVAEGASETLGPVLFEAVAYGVAYPLTISLFVGVAGLALRHRETVTARFRRAQA